MHDEPMDPFAGDPGDPSAGLAPEDPADPLTEDEKQDVLDDLDDLKMYKTLLEPSGIRGLVVDCEDCHEPHYFDWELLDANLRHLLKDGRPRVHEPAFNPDPEHYVTWDYARGYADGVQDTLAPEDNTA